MRHPFVAFASVLSALLALGCRGPARAPETIREPLPAEEYTGPPTPGDWLVSRFITDADNLNPIIEQVVEAQYIGSNIFPELMDSEFDCEIEYLPYLARSWEHSEDGRSITFHLREDARWEDGEPVDAEDVLFSYELYADPTVGSPRLGYVEGLTWSALDPHTVVATFASALPRGTQLFRTGLGLVPKHVLAHADRPTLRGNPFNKAPVVAGPWRVKEWRTGEQITLERNERCNIKPVPHLERVVFRIIKEETTAISEIKKGGIDMLELTSVDPIEDIVRSNPELRVIKRGWRFVDYIGWNSKDPAALAAAMSAAQEKGAGEQVDLDKVPPHPLFGTVKARRALTMAINRKAIIDGLLTVGGESYGRPATGNVTPELCNDVAEREPLPYDPDAAKTALAEEGWKDTDGDTVLDKDGRKAEFTLNYNAGNVRRERACVVIQSDLRKVGVVVNIQPLEGNLFFSNLRKKDFEAALAGWSAALAVEPRDIWHSGPYAFNFTSYSNERVDEIIDTAEKELDDGKRRAMWREMQQLIHEDQPNTFLYWFNQPIVIHRRFRDVECNVLSQYKDLEKWWVPTREQKWTKEATPEKPDQPAG